MKEQQKLDTLVRDLTCRTKPMSKSEARARIQEYAEEYAKEELTDKLLDKFNHSNIIK